MRENLRKARKARKWTQQEVADKIGVTLNYYQRVEYGRIGGAFWVWDALEDLFGVHQRMLRDSPDIERSDLNVQ
jgi:transcriptional regulator with XRE-family HTH domain